MLPPETEYYEVSEDSQTFALGDNVPYLTRTLSIADIEVYKNGKILFNERKKQPFLGYIGLPGGKLDFGESIPEQAAKELVRFISKWISPNVQRIKKWNMLKCLCFIIKRYLRIDGFKI
jgi:hypothetical protein